MTGSFIRPRFIRFIATGQKKVPAGEAETFSDSFQVLPI